MEKHHDGRDAGRMTAVELVDRELMGSEHAGDVVRERLALVGGRRSWRPRSRARSAPGAG